MLQIGVFVLNKCLKRLLNQDYEFRSYFRFYEIAKASRDTNIPVYFFSVANVDTEREVIQGTYYDWSKEIWRQKEFPYPNVLYDRRGGGSQASKEQAREIRQIFDQHHILRVNSKTHFDKWDLYDSLRYHRKLRPHLPVTKLNMSERYLLKFLKRHNRVYLKSLRGSRGLQVLRIEKEANGDYQFSYFRDDPIVGKVTNDTDLLKVVQAFFNNKAYIMQKEIDTLTVNNNKADFRAEVQRNGKGELEIVAISARVARDQSPISTHSVAYPHDEFFLHYLHYSDEEFMKINNKIYEFLFKAYLALEDTYGPFGEIGIDFALDKWGDFWFIEANAKSAKVSLYKAYDEETVSRAFRNPLEYARFIFEKERS